MSVQAMKGVEIGLGFEASRRFGSQVHDPIQYDPKLGRHALFRLHPAHEQRRRTRGGHDQLAAAGAPRRHEAD